MAVVESLLFWQVCFHCFDDSFVSCSLFWQHSLSHIGHSLLTYKSVLGLAESVLSSHLPLSTSLCAITVRRFLDLPSEGGGVQVAAKNHHDLLFCI